MKLAEEKRRELNRLWKEVLELKAEMERVLNENRVLVERRNSLRERVGELRFEVKKIRDERNTVNEEIRKLRNILADLRKEYQEKLNALRELKREVRERLRAKPNMDKESIEKEISDIDWRIQTSIMSLEEENKLVKRVQSLENQLMFYRKLEAMENEIASLGNEIKRIKDEIASCKNEIAEKIEKNRELRKRMTEYFGEIDKLRAEANKLHETYLENKEKLSSLRLKYVELLAKVTAIKKMIREEEEERKAEALAALKEKIEKEALEKLKRGEKLSFEEFKILIEQGKIKR